MYLNRSSHRRCSVIKGVFAGQPATLLKKKFWHRCFPVNFAKLLRTPFLQNTSGRLLLFKLKSINSVDSLRYFSVTKMFIEILNILKKIQKKIQRLGKVCSKQFFFLCFELKNKTKKQKYVCIDIQFLV